MNFKDILVPFDGSKFSKRSVVAATSLAQKYDGTILFLTCIGKFYTGRWYLDSRIEKEQSAKEYAKAQKELKKIKQQITDQGVSTKMKIVRTDNIVKQISDYAKKNKIDLIVMGSQGRTGLNKLLLGIKAEGTVHRVKCPVMIIK